VKSCEIDPAKPGPHNRTQIRGLERDHPKQRKTGTYGSILTEGKEVDIIRDESIETFHLRVDLGKKRGHLGGSRQGHLRMGKKKWTDSVKDRQQRAGKTRK